jgi:hypothetical protein
VYKCILVRVCALLSTGCLCIHSRVVNPLSMAGSPAVYYIAADAFDVIASMSSWQGFPPFELLCVSKQHDRCVSLICMTPCMASITDMINEHTDDRYRFV